MNLSNIWILSRKTKLTDLFQYREMCGNLDLTSEIAHRALVTNRKPDR